MLLLLLWGYPPCHPKVLTLLYQRWRRSLLLLWTCRLSLSRLRNPGKLRPPSYWLQQAFSRLLSMRRRQSLHSTTNLPRRRSRGQSPISFQHLLHKTLITANSLHHSRCQACLLTRLSLGTYPTNRHCCRCLLCRLTRLSLRIYLVRSHPRSL